MRKTNFSILLCIALMTPALDHSHTAQRINDVASKALDDRNLVKENTVIKLYGVRTNGPDTKDGNLACAKVASIVLREAGVGGDSSLSR